MDDLLNGARSGENQHTAVPLVNFCLYICVVQVLFLFLGYLLTADGEAAEPEAVSRVLEFYLVLGHEDFEEALTALEER